MHKESGQVVAIKQVPVDTDLQEIIKEISMMQQCDRFDEIITTLNSNNLQPCLDVLFEVMETCYYFTNSGMALYTIKNRSF